MAMIRNKEASAVEASRNTLSARQSEKITENLSNRLADELNRYPEQTEAKVFEAAEKAGIDHRVARNLIDQYRW